MQKPVRESIPRLPCFKTALGVEQILLESISAGEATAASARC